jgi:peptidoglycan hydrolase CwlO-like protein
MDEKTIKSKKQDVEKKFEEIKKQRDTAVEQIKQLQGRIAQYDAEINRLQGEFRLLEEFGKPEKKEEKK